MGWSLEQKRALVEIGHPQISLSRQCELLNLSRSSFYCQSQPNPHHEQENQTLLRLLDEQYTRTPFYGSRRLTHWLQTQGHQVNRKRVVHLMQQLGLQAIYPQKKRPDTSAPDGAHAKHPSLPRGVAIERVDQVWSSDITYIRLHQGWVSLVAILDWYSRYVLQWELSTSLDGEFCQEVLRRALCQGQPEIFNTDQGRQFTSPHFTGLLEAAQVRISHDGRGRALDNIFIERLWRTVKYEEVYLKDYDTPPTARTHLGAYFDFYNQQRLHQSLNYKTPLCVYREREEKQI